MSRSEFRRLEEQNDDGSVYLAVSVSNGCAYCIASHAAAAKKQGMTAEMLGEVLAVVGMANETNSLANGYRVPVDERFENLF